ncbi:TetR family transcriptional regulator [Cellulomonas chitinilytica]|uniref:TetR family transcriptional regulator n=1 Tax=Cellulomonas chitinilytica TaxID=398759 RepID=A0A919P7V2_9CELL|nr:TetR/AcrR family transcriptional regulator [Cellulomonas chitinilytica]GIG23623.1 TetR family transcriptional regulator [Cellulomonas chitinilytica]
MLRADARDNRDRTLEAARELFAERGLGVTMRDIARKAGVGPATVYRRFPTKQHLVVEVFTEEMRACRAVVDDACADPDPWRGLRTAVEELTTLNADHRAFVEVFLSADPDLEMLTEHRADLLRDLGGLAARAQAAGALRRDFVVGDLVLVLLAARALPSGPSADHAVAARRLAALAIDAFRASGAHSALPRPPRLTA